MDFAQSLTYWYLIHLSSLNQSRNGHTIDSNGSSTQPTDLSSDPSTSSTRPTLRVPLERLNGYPVGDSNYKSNIPIRIHLLFQLQRFISNDIYSYYIILYHSVYVFMMFRTCISNLATILIVTVTSSLASYSNQVLNRCQLCIYKKAKECILVWYTTGRFSEWRIGNPWLLGKQRNGVSFWILLSWATPTMRLRCFCRALLLNVKFALSHPEQRDVEADRIGFHIAVVLWRICRNCNASMQSRPAEPTEYCQGQFPQRQQLLQLPASFCGRDAEMVWGHVAFISCISIY